MPYIDDSTEYQFVKFKDGKEVIITEYTNEERQAFTSKSLYPRLKNEPTTSRYARGEADASAKTDTEGIIASKNKNLTKGKITSQFVPTENLTKNVPSKLNEKHNIERKIIHLLSWELLYTT